MSTVDTPPPAPQQQMGHRAGKPKGKTVRERVNELPRWQQNLLKLAVAAAVVGFLFYLPLFGIPVLNYLRTDAVTGGTSWAGTLFTCAIYVIIALGLNVVIGLAGLLDLGYVGFFAIGAYSVGLFGSPDSAVVKWMQKQFDLPENWAVAWAICVPIGIALTMISGVILGGPTLRLRGDYLAIVTLGFGEIIRIIARNSEFTGGPQGITQIPGPPGTKADGTKLFGVADIKPWYWLALVVLLILVFLVWRLEHSRVGRAWLAVREDEDAASVMGVYGFKFKLWAFAIGAVLGGMSGVLFGSRQAYIDPTNFSLQLSIMFVAMVVIGGQGNMLGVAVGAILLTYIPERFRELSDWRPLMVGLALVIIPILRPQGLIPSRRRARELKDREEEALPNA